MSGYKNIASPPDASHPNNGIEGRDERVVEYLRQRLASVVAAGSSAAMEGDVGVEHSSFSQDAEDGYEGSDQNGSEDAYPNIRAQSWNDDGDDELDSAWIIDRYCSWQEEDLEDALMEEGEGSEVNRLLGGNCEIQNDGKDTESSENPARRSGGFGEDSEGNLKFFKLVESHSQNLDSLTTKRLERIAKRLPAFTLPLRLSRTPSPSPSPSQLESIYDNRMSTSNTLVEVASPCTPPILSPGMAGHGDVLEPILTLDLIQDASFHATTAFLLGPDFGCDVARMARRLQQGQVSARENTIGLSSLLSNSVSEPEPGNSSSFRPLSTNDDKVLEVLDSLDISWKLFRSKTAVQKYLNTSVPPNEPWDFGICFERGNGTQHCVVTHARGIKRTYTDHMIVRAGAPAGNDVLAPGCKHLFWWCRPHPQWKEANAERLAHAKTLEEHYEAAKQRIEQFKERRAGWMKVALRQNYAQLLQDLPERERTTGRFSIHSMNIVLQLAEIAELIDLPSQADDWNRELVRRRAKRLGRESIHTCHARYRHAQLLYKMENYDQARDVSKENLMALKSFDDTYPLIGKQSILACAIAMKRRRIDQALQAVEHLWALESNHPGDLKTKEVALEVLYEAHSFKREYAEAEGYKRKQIEM
jgi:hypothetical protein